MDEPTAQRIKNELVDTCGEAIRVSMDSLNKPDRLYHFTDCQGLVGILTSRCLWASLATGLNDESEVRYGLERAERLLEANRPEGIASDFLSKVLYFLEPGNTSTGSSVELEPYVISFCASIDLSVHWLHYGKSGTGCAIGFNTDELIRSPFELTHVIYDETLQDQFIDSIVMKVWSLVQQYEINTKDCPIKETLYDIAAHSAAAHIRLGAAMMKNPTFQNEDEWRLITHDLRIDGREPEGQIPTDIKFRASGGRVVPYLEYPLDGVPITDLVLGFSFPMSEEDPAIASLLRKTAIGNPTVIRSNVPVRP